MNKAKNETRYKFLRGDKDIVPQPSTRWSRFRIEYWNGQYWEPLEHSRLDAVIDKELKAIDKMRPIKSEPLRKRTMSG